VTAVTEGGDVSDQVRRYTMRHFERDLDTRLAQRYWRGGHYDLVQTPHQVCAPRLSV
jgi:hypothetical protein